MNNVKNDRKTLAIFMIGCVVMGGVLLILWQTIFRDGEYTEIQEVVSTVKNSTKMIKQREAPATAKESMVFLDTKLAQDTKEMQEVDGHLIEPKEDVAQLPMRFGDLTTLGDELNAYLEENEVGYLNTSFYPFDMHTERALRQYAVSDRIMLFDNTESNHVLQSHGKNSSDLVAQFYGVAEPAEVILGAAIKYKDGRIEYMVLPINNSKEGQLIENVKAAIELFQTEKINKKALAGNGDMVREAS